jgi:putative PIN family toxin of toxin-antitoxin system
MRAVVDTNIIVSAALAVGDGGNPGRIAGAWRAGDLTLCVSAPIMAEYRDTLTELRLTAYLARTLALIENRRHCVYVKSPPRIRVIAADPTDDKFIECAVAADAGFVVTGDKGMHQSAAAALRWGVAIIKPADFARRHLGNREG